jgi:hypothetical protein
MNKKGDKSLNMIFALLSLIIVSFVVLNIFFKWIDLGNIFIRKEVDDTFQEGLLNDAILDCRSSCLNADTVDTKINYCRKFMQLDMNNNDVLEGEIADIGVHKACEDFVPCFVFTIPDCNIDAKACRTLLASKRPDLYTEFYDAEGTGTCSLNPADPTNWITKFGFNQSLV